MSFVKSVPDIFLSVPIIITPLENEAVHHSDIFLLSRRTF
ncbi:hypothetical protein PAP10c_p3053 (plasmid) [Pantoea agglomerans]|nr:hypothetical protein PAP10c_p3053 [Pantoea agglomerans]